MIVLDTHAWLWWASDSRELSAPARGEIAAASRIGICSISCWEIAMLAERGRIVLDREVLPWVEQALALPRVELLPITPAIAVRSASFSRRFPGDPADRIIAASAIAFRARLVSKDRRMKSLPELKDSLGILW